MVQHCVVGAASRTGKFEVMASGKPFSSHFDGGRARDDPHIWSKDATSNSALVSAAAFATNARCQLTFERRLRLLCHWMVSDFAFVESFTSVRQQHIAWKLSVSCARWTARALARSARYARASREIAFCVGRWTGGRSRLWCQNACTVQPERARSV